MANDLAEYESQPFEEFEEDLFYMSGTRSEDKDGHVVLKSGVVWLLSVVAAAVLLIKS